MTRPAPEQRPKQPPKIPRPAPVPRVAPPDDLFAKARSADTWPLLGPVVEGRCVVTFLWQDAEAEQVLLFANRLTDETHLDDTMLERLPGTDLWHVSFEMGADWRASYSFLTRLPGERAPWLGDGGQVGIRAALDRGRRDPRNPDTCRNRAAVLQSVVSLPDAPAQPWLAEREGVATGGVSSHVAPDAREVWIYDPPGVTHDEPLPLLVVLDGEVWVDAQGLPIVLDNMLEDREIPPVRALFVGSGGRDARWAELGADGSGADLVADLVSWTAQRRGVVAGSSIVVGQSLGGLTALRAGLLRPDVFAGVVSHSASLWQDDLGDLVEGARGSSVRVFLSHGSQEWVLDGPHRVLAERLVAAGIAVRPVPVNGGHDYAWWRGGVSDGLSWLLGDHRVGGGG